MQKSQTAQHNRAAEYTSLYNAVFYTDNEYTVAYTRDILALRGLLF